MLRTALLCMAATAASLAAAQQAGGSGASPAAGQTEPATEQERLRSYVLPGEAVFPEGITYQPATRNFYVSSTTDGSIYRGTLGQPKAEVFLPGGQDGRTTAIGVKVDDAGRLFVAGGATGRIFVYDTKTRQLLRAYDTPQAKATFINDVALTGDAAYFTDSQRPVLFRVPVGPGGPGELEPWLDLSGTAIEYKPGFNLNGIAVTPDMQYLLVVQSNTGKLFRVGLKDKKVVEVKLGGEPLTNGDGLLLDGRTLYVVRNQNGVIVPVRLGEDYASGTVGTPFPQDSGLKFPTTLARTNGHLLVVNSQFDRRGEGKQPELPFTVSSLPIPR